MEELRGIPRSKRALVSLPPRCCFIASARCFFFKIQAETCSIVTSLGLSNFWSSFFGCEVVCLSTQLFRVCISPCPSCDCCDSTLAQRVTNITTFLLHAIAQTLRASSHGAFRWLVQKGAKKGWSAHRRDFIGGGIHCGCLWESKPTS